MEIAELHFFSLILTLPVILYADHMGFLYLTGRKQTLEYKKVAWAHRLVFVGISLLIITGIALTIPRIDYLLTKPFFYAKMALVITLVINGLFIGNTMKKATTTPFQNLEKDEKNLMIVSGAISGLSWLATILIGFLGL